MKTQPARLPNNAIKQIQENWAFVRDPTIGQLLEKLVSLSLAIQDELTPSMFMWIATYSK